MPSGPGEIRALPADVAAQIKSSTAVPSLSHAALSLIENSLDAEAVNIDVSVDYGRATCCVEDDGNGILPADFKEDGGLGKSYHTSNLGGDTRRHGRHGVFLSSLAATAILTITSRRVLYNSTSTLVYHHSRVAARLVPAPLHHQLAYRNHGTRVQLQDLFGNMPVRVKQRPIADDARKVRGRQWDWLRKQITGMLLAWDKPVFLTVRGHDEDQILRFRPQAQFYTPSASVPQPNLAPNSFNLDVIRDTLHQGASVDLLDWNSWVKTSARTPFMTIRGIISLQPAPTKEIQFISLGLKHISSESECNILYDEVNALFISSSFGVQEETSKLEELLKMRRDKNKRLSPDNFTQKQLKGGGKGIDRWPMFYIRIDQQAEPSPCFQFDRNALGDSNNLLSIVKVLEAMVTGFLAEHHLRPHKRRPSLSGQASSSRDRSFAAASISRDLVEIKKSNPLTGRLVCGDISEDSKTPKVSGPKSSGVRADFSGWSRIKRSTMKVTSETSGDQFHIKLTNKRSPNDSSASSHTETQNTNTPTFILKQGSVTTVSCLPVLHHTVDDSMDDSGPALWPASGGTDLTQEIDCRTQSDEAPLIWTNPNSKVTVKINARTGSVISDKFESRSFQTLGAQPTRLAESQSMSKKVRQTLSRTISDPSLCPKEGSWVEALMKSWENPIFLRTEKSIPQVSGGIPGQNTEFFAHRKDQQCSRFNLESAFTEASTTILAAKLNKASLGEGKVIAQVDKKFILVKVAPVASSDGLVDANELLILVDQHAADERIRLESLLASLCTRATGKTLELTSSLGLRSSIETARLSKPIKFDVNKREHLLFKRHAAHFSKWGILYDLSPLLSDKSTVAVLTLPDVIAERCRIDVKQLGSLLRVEAWSREEAGVSRLESCDLSQVSASGRGVSAQTHIIQSQVSWPQLIQDCPQGILEMLNSRSCRSAIMFNDELTLLDCQGLIQRLAACMFPFQCAHGRPSMVPFVNINSSHSSKYPEPGVEVGQECISTTLEFREAWKSSKLLSSF
ncbi:DNA mismatch repair protein [Lambiella insularis]|nr:DNA mismatch repair protein [Lambiella insularis]